MCDKEFVLIIRAKQPNFALLFLNGMTLEYYNLLVPDRYRLTYYEFHLLQSLKFKGSVGY